MGGGGREREREREYLYVCVCVCGGGGRCVCVCARARVLALVDLFSSYGKEQSSYTLFFFFFFWRYFEGSSCLNYKQTGRRQIFRISYIDKGMARGRGVVHIIERYEECLESLRDGRAEPCRGRKFVFRRGKAKANGDS